MKITEEQLLAYALDEIESKLERAEVESAIKADPMLQEALSEIEQLGSDLTVVLKSAPDRRLDPERVALIRMQSTPRKFNMRWIAYPTGIAAVLTLMFYLGAPAVSGSIAKQAPKNPKSLAIEGTETPNKTEINVPLLADSEPQEFSEPQESDGFHAAQVPAGPSRGELASVPVTSLDTQPVIQPASSSAPLAGSKAISGSFFGVSPAKGPTIVGSSGMAGNVARGRNRELASSESYNPVNEPDFVSPKQAPLSTFSIDVDTASYTNVRRILNSNSLPPKDSVRVEEMLNFFRYNFPQPNPDSQAISVLTNIADCPWNTEHRLARIALSAKNIDPAKRPAVNLVFLVDVSGSMAPENKLPLVKQSLETLVNELSENDRVAIVTYAGTSGVVLPSTSAHEKAKIVEAIRGLVSGGSTNGASGIELAYEQAASNEGEAYSSRVILLTDGDFNVGIRSQADLKHLIQSKAKKSSIFLNVYGFGMGNLKDSTLETLSQNGNGQYGYIDSEKEAQRVFVSQLTGSLVTVAKDVKFQIEFNPAKVSGYRLVGYENRKLADADFRDDAKDAGEIGSGHSVTALYEIIPAGAGSSQTLRYQQAEEAQTGVPISDETLSVAVRYLDEATGKRVEFNQQLVDSNLRMEKADPDFQFAAGVAAFGMLLRDSRYKGNATYDMVFELATAGVAATPAGSREERAELIDLARKAKQLGN